MALVLKSFHPNAVCMCVQVIMLVAVRAVSFFQAAQQLKVRCARSPRTPRRARARIWLTFVPARPQSCRMSGSRS